MKHIFLTTAAIVLPIATNASADNACATPTISTSADVTTSKGAAYKVDSYYRNPMEIAVRFASDETSLLVIEGPLAWTQTGDDLTAADDEGRRFITGHQFHALGLLFDDVIANAQPVRNVEFNGARHDGRSGAYPDGGTATLLEDENNRPLGLILDLPDTSEITVSYGDWRQTEEDRSVPFSATVTHEGVVYTYQYTDFSFGTGDAVAFHQAYPAPDIDAAHIYRLHRALLAAHCRGDAEMMASLTAPEAFMANRGDITSVSPDDMKARFSSVFSRVNYRAYTDLKSPQIEVAESGDLGWALVSVQAEGEVIDTGEPFSDQWAWALLAKKLDGVWLNAGNASNVKPE